MGGTLSARDHKSPNQLLVGTPSAQKQPIAFDTTQITSPYNYSSPKPGDPCHPLAAGAHPPAVAFAQNTRDEVRLVNGDGQLVGALAALPGMKQTTYVAQQPAGSVFQDSEFGVKEYPTAGTLRAGRIPEHQMVIQPIAFHPTQDPISSLDGVSHAVSNGSTGGQAVAQPYTLAIRGRGDGRNLEYRNDGTANALLLPNGGRDGLGVGAIAQPVAFHPTQDPISSTDGVSHAMRNGSKGGTATVAVAVGIPVPMVNMQGSKGNAVAQADGPSYTLNAMHGHDVHAIAVCATGEVTHALTASTRKGASEDGTGRGTPLAAQPSMQVRRLTPTECERLQGFPDDHTSTSITLDGKVKTQADGPRYKQLGNAVTVNVAEWIAKRLVATMTTSKETPNGRKP